MRRTHLLYRSMIVAATVGILSVPAVGTGEEPPPDKPVKGFALEEALKDTDRPPRSGVVLETPKAEVVDKDGKKVLRVGWRITYSGDRWPLVIREPSLTRAASRGTEIDVIAKGKSGEAYRTALANPRGGLIGPPTPAKDWFLTVPKEKGRAEGVLEADLAEVKRLLLKYFPEDFDPKAAPELYVRLEHDVVERGDEVDLDAWTGHLMATPVKVANPKW